MRIKAKFGVQVKGFGIVDRGRVIDLPASLINERIASNFTTEDDKPIEVDSRAVKDAAKAEPAPTEKESRQAVIERTVNALKREGIMSSLDGMGVTYSARAKTEYLAKLLLITRGDITEE